MVVRPSRLKQSRIDRVRKLNSVLKKRKIDALEDNNPLPVSPDDSTTTQNINKKVMGKLTKKNELLKREIASLGNKNAEPKKWDSGNRVIH